MTVFVVDLPSDTDLKKKKIKKCSMNTLLPLSPPQTRLIFELVKINSLNKNCELVTCMVCESLFKNASEIM